MPAFIRGVINLRGRVVPVVDMAARFGRGTTSVARRTSIIIVETSRQGAGPDGETVSQDIGIMVDAVNKVVHLDAGDIEPAPTFGAGIRSDFIAGMAKCDGEFVIVLDVSRVLSIDEMVLLGEAAVAGHAVQPAADVDEGQAWVSGGDPSPEGPAETAGDA
jgi:purine-binding chemotaxis protein CheW